MMKNYRENKIIALILLFSFVFLLLAANPVSANSSTIYVNESCGNDLNNGLSWHTAKLTIKNATDTVSNGGTVNIANGVYSGPSNTAININKNMTINGQNQYNTIIDGKNTSQIFIIDYDCDVTINNLTFVNATTAIHNNGNLIIENSNFVNNTAGYDNSGAIFNSGQLTIYNSNFTGSYGGAIYNKWGTISVENSNFNFNTANYGGAIYNEWGTLTIKNSNFTNNSLTGGEGGAIYTERGTLTVKSSNFLNNTANYGGAISNGYIGILNVSGSNFINNAAVINGGAINSWDGTVTLENNNFVNNTAGQNGGAIGNACKMTIINSNFTNNTAIEYNGGAINNNGALFVNNDTFNNNPGIGGDICNNGGTMNLTNNKFIGNTTPLLQILIYDTPINGILKLQSGIYTGNTMDIYKNITIVGSEDALNPTIINAQLNNIFTIEKGITVPIKNLFFVNATSSAIRNNGNLIIENSNFVNNTAGYDNGGAIVNSGQLTIYSSNFTNNNATYGSGGAIYSEGNLTIYSSNFISDLAYGGGGAISSTGTSTIENCNFTNNTAIEYNGGAISNSGKMDVNNSKFTGNTCPGIEGGAIGNGGAMTLKNSVFSFNTANNGGGGAVISGGILTIENCKFIENFASEGGAISISDGILNISNSNFTENAADGSGGAISNGGTWRAGGNVTIENCNFVKNTSKWFFGGAICDYGTLTIKNSNFTENKDVLWDYNGQYGYGGAIYISEGIVDIENSNFINNTAADYGGAIANGGANSVGFGSLSYGGDLSIKNSTFINNYSPVAGAVYNVVCGTLNISESNFISNSATYAGAIRNGGNLTVYSSNFINNSATDGGAIYNKPTGNATAFFNRFINNTNYEMYNDGIMTAENNWWGSDSDPSSQVYGAVDVTPWLVYNPAPTVTAVDPASSAVNVLPNKVIQITFSQPIKIGTGWIELINSSGTSIPITTSINGYVLTISHTALLNGKYTLALHTGSLTNLAGNNINAYATSFTVDMPPTITTSDPANNAVNVPRNKVITVTFSEPIKAGNMWIELYNTVGTKTLMPITTTISSNVLTINHATLLATGTKYTLAFHTGSITDLAGNSLAGVARYFTTSTDISAPTITSTDPANNAVNVPRNKVITVTFNEPIKAGNMWIELYNTVGTKTLIPITTNISGNVLTINHAALLANGTKYILAFHTGSITDNAGNPIASAVRYFTTSTDTTAPTIISTDPANNAVNIPRNKVITVTFNEPIKAGNMWIELYNTVGTKTLIPITTNISGNVLTINHAALLANGTKYTLAFHTGSITDNAGNPIASAVRYFTTGSV